MGVSSRRWDDVDDIGRARQVPSPQLIGTPERRSARSPHAGSTRRRARRPPRRSRRRPVAILRVAREPRRQRRPQAVSPARSDRRVHRHVPRRRHCTGPPAADDRRHSARRHSTRRASTPSCGPLDIALPHPASMPPTSIVTAGSCTTAACCALPACSRSACRSYGGAVRRSSAASVGTQSSCPSRSASTSTARSLPRDDSSWSATEPDAGYWARDLPVRGGRAELRHVRARRPRSAGTGRAAGVRGDPFPGRASRPDVHPDRDPRRDLGRSLRVRQRARRAGSRRRGRCSPTTAGRSASSAPSMVAASSSSRPLPSRARQTPR